MNMEKPFKLFSLPRLSGTQVSAVKPQTVSGERCFQGLNKCIEEDLNSSFTKANKPDLNINKNPDSFSQKVKHLPVIEEESLEPVSQLYSKLFNEAERIKRWKGSIESEIQHKEKKLHDNKRTIDAQRKAIQELQFENEKLSLKLEDEINENRDLLNENNATRHLCDLLKETCARSLEKTSMYDHEREEYGQLYGELTKNTERMMMAFEELRVQAENSRLEMHFKLKEESEKRQTQEKNFTIKIREKEEQVSHWVKQNLEKEKELSDIKFQLSDSRKKMIELNETAKEQNEKLEKSTIKLDTVIAEFEEMRKIKDIELQTAKATLLQATEDKERCIEELKDIQSKHEMTVTELQTIICNLKDMLTTEQMRLKETEDMVQSLNLELKMKSSECGELTKLKHEHEIHFRELTNNLETIQELSNEKERVEMLVEELKESQQDLKNIIRVKEVTIQELSNEKERVDILVEELKESQQDLKNIIRDKEEMIQELSNEKERVDILVVGLKESQQDLTNIIREKEEMIQELSNEKERVDILVVGLKESQQDLTNIIREKEVTAQDLSSEKERLDILVEELRESQQNLKNIIRVKEDEINELKMQISATSDTEENCYKRLADLKAELIQKELKCQELAVKFDKLAAEKEQSTEDINAKVSEINNLQKALKASKQNEEKAQKEIQNMEDSRNQIRNELESLKKKMELEGEEVQNKLDESVDKTKNIETKISKKDKQLKALENKNKALKKKLTAESKEQSILQDEVNQLNMRLENVQIERGESVNVYQNEIAARKITEESLNQEVNKLKIELENSRAQYEETVKRYNNLIEEKSMAEARLCEEVNKLKIELENSRAQYEETVKRYNNLKEEKSMAEARLCEEANKLKIELEKSRAQYEETAESSKNLIEEKSIAEARLCEEANKLKIELEKSRAQYEETAESSKNLIEEKSIAEARLCEEVNKLKIELEYSTAQYEERAEGYKNVIEKKSMDEARLREEVKNLKLLAEEATKSQKDIDIRCQHKIAEMVALMEKHKHQYDKMVEEKHIELGMYKTKEQETLSAKVSLEIELSYLKNEVSSLKKELEKEILEKGKVSRELKDTRMSLRKEIKHKITQTEILETPKRSSLKLNAKLIPSSKKSLCQPFMLSEQSIKADFRDKSSLTPAKAFSTPRKIYTVKTPPKHEKFQKEGIHPHAEEASIKKRKVALSFDLNSDSSETTDLLSMVSEEDISKKLYVKCPEAAQSFTTTPKKSMVSEEDISKKLYVKCPEAAQSFTTTPKKVYTVSTLKSPGSAIKRAAVRKMREAGWTAVSNMDRKKKMKAAERLFI
ncbi:synaptonemal complex protein 1 isoform X3 [Lissotriton helveticus]